MFSKKFSYQCMRNVFQNLRLSYHKINKSGLVKPNCVDEIPVVSFKFEFIFKLFSSN